MVHGFQETSYNRRDHAVSYKVDIGDGSRHLDHIRDRTHSLSNTESSQDDMTNLQQDDIACAEFVRDIRLGYIVWLTRNYQLNTSLRLLWLTVIIAIANGHFSAFMCLEFMIRHERITPDYFI